MLQGFHFINVKFDALYISITTKCTI